MADLIEVRDLSIEFDNRGTMVPALDRISFGIPPGSTVALVGESGSGKSVTAQAIMGILPKTAHITSGEILFSAPGSTRAPVDVTRLDPDGAAIRAIRGRHISMIFQEPMVSLSPLHTIGDQVSEALFLHHKVGHAEGMRRTEEMLRLVGFPNPARALAQLSVRALRRAAPARDDRDGARVPAVAADRRRADHGARRDDPGADPRAHHRAAGRAQHGGAHHHARPRRRREPRRGGGRPLRRPRDGTGPDRRALSAARASLPARAAERGAAFRHEARRAARSGAADRSPDRRARAEGRAVAGRCAVDPPRRPSRDQDVRPARHRFPPQAKGRYVPRGRRREHRDPARRVLRPRRRERLRQDDALQADHAGARGRFRRGPLQRQRQRPRRHARRRGAS